MKQPTKNNDNKHLEKAKEALLEVDVFPHTSYLTAAQIEGLKLLAVKRKTSVSDLMRGMVDKFLEEK